MDFYRDTNYDAISGLGIETPESVKRKVDGLGKSFQALAKSYPNSEYILSEAKNYEAFRKGVEDNWLSRFFASSTAGEFEKWQLRYRDAYESGKKSFPEVSVIAPHPDTIVEKQGFSLNSLAYAAVAGAVVVGIMVVFLKK